MRGSLAANARQFRRGTASPTAGRAAGVPPGAAEGARASVRRRRPRARDEAAGGRGETVWAQGSTPAAADAVTLVECRGERRRDKARCPPLGSGRKRVSERGSFFSVVQRRQSPGARRLRRRGNEAARKRIRVALGGTAGALDDLSLNNLPAGRITQQRGALWSTAFAGALGSADALRPSQLLSGSDGAPARGGRTHRAGRRFRKRAGRCLRRRAKHVWFGRRRRGALRR